MVENPGGYGIVTGLVYLRPAVVVAGWFAVGRFGKGLTVARTIVGELKGNGLKLAIVAGRFNEFITSRLVAGATDCLVRHGVSADDVTLVWCPGAFEMPLVAQKLTASDKYDAVICLGAVIRGQTPHFDYVAGQVARGVAQVNLVSGIPVLFGIITSDTIEQAIERAGTKAGNKGSDAAASAIEMVNLLKNIEA